jgi:hypothetical protein
VTDTTIAEDRTVRTAISLGYPEEEARRTGRARKPLSEIVHEERYGQEATSPP